MNHLLRLALLIGVAGCLAGTAAAQYVAPKAGNWGVTMEAHVLSGDFDPRVSADYGYAARGWGAGVGGGFVYRRYVLLGGELGFALFGADRKLPEAGRDDYDSETTNALLGAMYAGLVSPALDLTPRLGRRWWLGVLAGSGKWNGERRRSGCETCVPASLRMRAGPFVEPFIVVGVGNADYVTGFRIGHRMYVADYARIRSSTAIGLHIELRNLN